MTKEIRKHGADAWVRTVCVVDEIDTFLARHHDIVQAARGRHLRLAVVTDSSAVAGAASGLRWLGLDDIRSCAPRELNDATPFLRLSDPQARAVRTAIERLRFDARHPQQLRPTG